MPALPLLRPSLPHRWASSWVDPGVFDFWAGQLNPLWTWERPLARIVARRQVARRAVTLRLQPNRHWAGGLAGQHLNLGVQINGRWLTRSYSLSAAPAADRCFEVTVQQVEGGLVSTHLCQQAQVGEVVAVGPAFGEMTLPYPPLSPAKHQLFLAAGSGITPFLALSRALAASAQPMATTLIVWAKTRDDVCQLDELQALATRAPGLTLQLVLTGKTQAGSPAPTGRLSSPLLPALLPAGLRLDETLVMACGPAGFVNTARALLAPQVLNFQAEAFSPDMAATDTNSMDPDATVQIHLQRSGRSLTVAAGQALLPALEAQGLTLPSGCRMGICRSCVCTRLSGSTQDTQTLAIDDQPGAALRLCVARPCGDLSLDL